MSAKLMDDDGAHVALGSDFLAWLKSTTAGGARVGAAHWEAGGFVKVVQVIGDETRVLTLKGPVGDFAPEAAKALAAGGRVAAISCVVDDDGQGYKFTIDENMVISGAKYPKIEKADDGDDLDVEAQLLEQIALQDRVIAFVESAFGEFLKVRLSDGWRKVAADVVPNF